MNGRKSKERRREPVRSSAHPRDYKPPKRHKHEWWKGANPPITTRGYSIWRRHHEH